MALVSPFSRAALAAGSCAFISWSSKRSCIGNRRICNYQLMTRLILENFLPYRFNRLSSWISREFRAVYGPHHDLTVPEWRVLATLGEFDTMTANAIGAHSC